MLSDREINRNRRAVEHALAQQALEGLTMPSASVLDLERVARGEITSTDALCNSYARFSNPKSKAWKCDK